MMSIIVIVLLGLFSFTYGDRYPVGPSRGGYHEPAAPSWTPMMHGHGGHTSTHNGGSQSFFDIALAGLAFLSFGTFLLNMLLNALFGGYYVTGTVVPTSTNTGIITQTATLPTVTDMTMTEPTVLSAKSGMRRGKRSVLDLSLDPVTSTDIIAGLVLKSIDAMVKKHECVQKVFCDGNKEAKVVQKGYQYLMPAYSFGVSYIAEKIGLHRNMPDHLNAILHGMEGSSCESHFPQC